MNIAENSLINFLVNKNLLIKNTDIKKLDFSNQTILQCLEEANLISKSQTFRAISEHLKIKIFSDEDIDNIDVSRTLELIKNISFKKCHESKFIPVVFASGSISLLLTNPFDLEIINEMRFVIDQNFEVFIISHKHIISLLCRCDPHESQVFDELSNLEFGAQLEILNPPDEDSTYYDDNLKTPIVSLVNKIIVESIKSKASDIHIEPNQWSLEIRNRIDGTLHKVLEVPKRLQKAVIARIKLLANMDISEHRKPQDGRLQLKVNGQITDLRVSCIPTSQGECLVLRILQTDKNKLKLDNLNLPKDVKSKLKNAISAEGKMLLVTGPTGSGKTTTLYSCLTELQKNYPNIVTVEDPIEYRLEGINQMQVNELAGVTFASALRSIMRQDPDIILIGEIRDFETADIAIQAAQTGHLVLSTLHTNDAPSAITRLLDLGVESFMISSSVSGIIAQRLVRKICPHCISYLNDDLIKQYREDPCFSKYKIRFNELKMGLGCSHCRDTGYIGRAGIYSFLEITKNIADAMQNKINLNEIIRIAEKDGFVDLDLQAVIMARNGITTLEEIRPYLISGSSVTTENNKVELNSIGILSQSEIIKSKLFEAINRDSSLTPLSIDANDPKLDLNIYIIDESLPNDNINFFISSLEEKKASPNLIILGKIENKKLNDYNGKTEVVAKGSSPLMLINKCQKLLQKHN